MPARTPLSAEEARDERIAQLERSTRRRVTGVQLPVAVLCLAGTLFLLAREAPDVAYVFASREPVTLGSEGAYQLDRLRPNVYAQIHGVPLGTAFYGVERGARIVLVGLQDTPVVVRRPLLPTEDWVPGKKPPPPDSAPLRGARAAAPAGRRPRLPRRGGQASGAPRAPARRRTALGAPGGRAAGRGPRAADHRAGAARLRGAERGARGPGAQALLQERAARRRPNNLRSV